MGGKIAVLGLRHHGDDPSHPVRRRGKFKAGAGRIPARHDHGARRRAARRAGIGIGEDGAFAGEADWQKLSARLEGPRDEAIVGSDDALWEACQASHRGFLVAAPLLLMVQRIGIRAGFLDIRVNDALEPVFPTRFSDEEQAAQLIRALAPPPKASANEIVTPMGGSFFAREAPHLPPLIDEGEHFHDGQPLFIIEVMKMFNKVLAPFSGTLKRNLMADSDGCVVKTGQVIFEIEPDEVLVEESVEDISARRRATTLAAFGA